MQSRILSILFLTLASANLYAYLPVNHSGDKSDPEAVLILIAAVLSALSIFLIREGFKSFKLKRTIENIPTSRIRSIAMGGLVEIKGKICGGQPMLSPLCREQCVYYSFDVVSGSGKHKETVATGNSTEPFYLTDGTGVLLIEPTFDTSSFHKDFKYSGTFGKPELLKAFLKKQGFDTALTQINTCEIRLIIGNPLYLLGAVEPYQPAPVKPLLDFIGSRTEEESVHLIEDFLLNDFLDLLGIESSGIAELSKMLRRITCLDSIRGPDGVSDLKKNLELEAETKTRLCRDQANDLFVVDESGEDSLKKRLFLSEAGYLSSGGAATFICLFLVWSSPLVFIGFLILQLTAILFFGLHKIDEKRQLESLKRKYGQFKS
ncbi:MAG: hypothetical protein PHW04_10275 [Candidatus Wallbacteria bacterium]|nr:hypothetical protein [Candidatus Wallbacteria bacterium]